LDRRVAIARRRSASFDALWLLAMTTRPNATCHKERAAG
jgi:hypothetical protein